MKISATLAVVRVSFMVDATEIMNKKYFQNCAASLKRQLNYTGKTAGHYLRRLRSEVERSRYGWVYVLGSDECC